MPRPPAPLPHGLGRHFSVRQSAELGVSKRRVRARDLEAPFHGARRLVEQEETEQIAGPLEIDRAHRRRVRRDARTYAQVMTPHSFFCGRTAAVLFGAPVTPHDELDVAVLAPLRAPRGAGIRGRIVSPHLVEVEVRDGLALTSPAATWAMLARELTERDLVVLGDAFVRIPRDDLGRRQPTQALATLAQLCAAVDAGRRRPKVIRLSAALERIRVGSASPLETEFRLDASTDGLPEAVLDAEIRGESGRLLGISEFAYPRFRTVVEIEGDHHRTSNRQWNRDLAKYRDYADAGWEVVRLTSRNIRGHAPPDATTIVRRVLLRHGWDGRRR